MPKPDELSVSILDRMLEQRQQQLENARLLRNESRIERLRHEISALRADRRKLCQGRSSRACAAGRTTRKKSARATPRPSARRAGSSRARTTARRPTLRDDGAVVAPHSRRWEALTAYVRRLGESFPHEDVVRMSGLYSTEREFARLIRRLESRLPLRAAATERIRRTRAAPRRRTAQRARQTQKRSARKRAVHSKRR